MLHLTVLGLNNSVQLPAMRLDFRDRTRWLMTLVLYELDELSEFLLSVFKMTIATGSHKRATYTSSSMDIQ